MHLSRRCEREPEARASSPGRCSTHLVAEAPPSAAIAGVHERTAVVDRSALLLWSSSTAWPTKPILGRLSAIQPRGLDQLEARLVDWRRASRYAARRRSWIVSSPRRAACRIAF